MCFTRGINTCKLSSNMKSFQIFFYIIGAVAIALLGNSISAIWAKSDEKFSLWLLAILIIAPMVFILFGVVTSKIGLAISSGVIDSLLTVSSVLVGLIVFQEWQRVTVLQYLGMALALAGIFLMLFSPKAGA